MEGGIPKAVAMTSALKDGSKVIRAPLTPLSTRLSAYSYITKNTSHYEQKLRLVYFDNIFSKNQ